MSTPCWDREPACAVTSVVPLPPWPATAAVSSALPPIYTSRQPPAADTRWLHPAALGGVGRKHRTSQAGVGGSRAPPRTWLLPTELAAAGATSKPGTDGAQTPRRGAAAHALQGLSQVEAVNTTLRTAHNAMYVLHRRNGDWMMRSARRVRLAIAIQQSENQLHSSARGL